jgi:hypothetical protein
MPKKSKGHNLLLSDLVDELGQLKAQIAELVLREQEIKTVLCDTGESLIRGQSYQASISESERTTLDNAKVKLYLNPAQLISCQRVSVVKTVRVSARSES